MKRPPSDALNDSMSPIAPRRTRSRASSTWGKVRRKWLTRNSAPPASAAATARSASAALVMNGFSHRTRRPSRSDAWTRSACVDGGVDTMIASAFATTVSSDAASAPNSSAASAAWAAFVSHAYATPYSDRPRSIFE